MRFLLLTFLFLANCSYGQSIDQPNLLSKNSISTIAYWSIGEKKKYRCTQVRSDFKKNQKKPFEEQKYTFDLVVSVIDSTDSSYLMRMSYSKFNDLTERKKRSVSPQLMKDYHVDYVTDEFGIFDSISNSDELKELLSIQIAQRFDDLDLPKDSIAKKISEVLDNEFKSDLIQLIFQREIILFHSFFGMELKLNAPIDLELEYPPIGDVMMMGEGKLKLTSIDPERDNCRLMMTQKPYKDEIQLFLQELIVQLFGFESLNGDLSNMSFSSSSKINGIMELSTGWMQKISNVTTFKLVENKKEKKIVLQTTIERN